MSTANWHFVFSVRVDCRWKKIGVPKVPFWGVFSKENRFELSKIRIYGPIFIKLKRYILSIRVLPSNVLKIIKIQQPLSKWRQKPQFCGGRRLKRVHKAVTEHIWGQSQKRGGSRSVLVTEYIKIRPKLTANVQVKFSGQTNTDTRTKSFWP